MTYLRKVADFLRGQSPLGVLVLLGMGVFPLFSDNIFHIEIIKLAALYAVFAMSWDILTGYTHEVNFGFAFFIGGAGYLSGILNAHLGLSPYLAIPVGALAAGLAGVLIGYLTLRLKGPYFSMATLAFSAILFKLSFILYQFTGGEEGISGVEPFTDDPTRDLYVVWVVTVAVYVVLWVYARSKHGTILKAIRADEDATQSAGINTAYYKTEAFALSGFMAGIGGGLFTHSQMHIGPSMLSGYLSTIVVLLAMIGGMGTIVGPLVGAVCLSILNEVLRVVEEYRIIIYTGLLIFFIYVAPEGFANLSIVKRTRFLSFLFLGDRKSL
jgi:branched-chain amino acid transport system permease protein